MMQYKGYHAQIEFDHDAGIFHGEVLGIRDVVTFQGHSVEEAEQAFKDSVQDYLAFCKERGKQPEKPTQHQELKQRLFTLGIKLQEVASVLEPERPMVTIAKRLEK